VIASLAGMASIRDAERGVAPGHPLISPAFLASLDIVGPRLGLQACASVNDRLSGGRQGHPDR
jgi:hypothetical protein